MKFQPDNYKEGQPIGLGPWSRSSDHLVLSNRLPQRHASGFQEDNVLCSFRFLALLALIFVVIFSLGITVAFIYTISTQALDRDVIEEYWNDRPIIGILAMEYYGENDIEHQRFYIAASYIKFVEGGGGRAVPVMINQTRDYYDKIFQGINGLLFPGGGVYFNESGYATAGKYLMTLAKEANDKGDYFPVWATCLGFEYLVYEALGDKDALAHCNVNNVSTTIQFTSLASKSRLFGRAPSPVTKILSTQAVASNFHNLCLTEEVLVNAHGLENIYKVLSWSRDPSHGTRFVSSIEAIHYPFFGVQFHPEKNSYEWSWKKSIPHTSEAVLIGQYFAQFFVNQARKSRHTFGSYEEEVEQLIYNYNVTYTGGPSGDGSFQQKYIFPQSPMF